MILQWGGPNLSFIKGEDRLIVARSFASPVLLQKIEWIFPVPVKVTCPWAIENISSSYNAWDKGTIQWESGALASSGFITIAEIIPPAGHDIDALAEQGEFTVTYSLSERSSFCRIIGKNGENFTDAIKHHRGCEISDARIIFTHCPKQEDYSEIVIHHDGRIQSIAIVANNASLMEVWCETPDGESKLFRSFDGRAVNLAADCKGQLLFKIKKSPSVENDSLPTCSKIIIQMGRGGQNHPLSRQQVGESFSSSNASLPSGPNASLPSGPKVSVIIPAYNRRHCLFSTVASVFSQTYQNFEVLIIDDGSTDNTQGEIEWFRAAFPGKLRYIRLTHNQGESYARNVGIDLSKGEFIAFLDSDDQWAPQYLEKMIGFLQAHPAANLVWCYVNFFTVHSDGAVTPENYSWVNQPNQPWDTVHNKIWLGPQHVMYRRKDALYYNPDIDRAEDAELYERMIAAGYVFSNLQEALVSIYHHADSQNRSNSFSSQQKQKQRKRTRPLTKAVELERTNLASLCMLTWNRGDITPSVLSNLADTADAPFEFIIIDNGSTDSMTQWLYKQYDHLVLNYHKVVFNPWNVGIPAALNQGLLISEGDLFLHAASDIFMESEFLHKLMKAFNSIPDLGVAGVLYDKITPETYRVNKSLPIPINELVPDSNGFIPAIGPAICLPRDVLTKLGYWNEELGKYGREDTLICRRAKAAGYRVGYLTDTVAFHRRENEAPQGRSAASEAKRKELSRNLPYALDYSRRLLEGEQDLIKHGINDHFNIVGSARPNIKENISPPMATLVFTIRNNNLAMIKKAVQSAVSNATVPIEVVFVCLNAERHVVEFILELRKQLIKDGCFTHVCNHRGNWGIAKAYNTALGYSYAPYIVTLNDDIIAGGDWLSPLIAVASRPDAGYVCSNLSQHQAYLNGDYSITMPAQIKGNGVAAIQAKNFVGFASVIDRRKLTSVGCFNERTHIYHAETDMALRLENAGFQSYEVLDSRVLHLRAASTGFAETTMRNMANAHLPDSFKF